MGLFRAPEDEKTKELEWQAKKNGMMIEGPSFEDLLSAAKKVRLAHYRQRALNDHLPGRRRKRPRVMRADKVGIDSTSFLADLEQDCEHMGRISYAKWPTLKRATSLFSSVEGREAFANEHLSSQGVPIYDSRFSLPFKPSDVGNVLKKSLAGNGVHLPTYMSFCAYVIAHASNLVWR